MSRSNGPAGRGQAPQPHQWRQDPHAGQQAPRASWPPEAYPAEGYAQDPAQQQHAQHQQYAATAAPQAYHFPEAAEPVTARTAPPLPRTAAYGQQQHYAPPQQSAYPPVDPRMTQHAPQTGWPPAQDPRNYDLGNYMPSDAAEHAQAGYQAQGYPTQTMPQQRAGRAYGAEPGEPSLDAAHYGAPHQQGGYPSAAHAQAGQHPDQGYAEADDYEQAEDEQEESGRGRRGLVIVAALIGAIAIGGGLAYAYKSFGNKLVAGNKAPAPVVKAPVEAAKAKPTTPDGKQFANQDSKILNERVGTPGAPVDVAASQMSAAIQAGSDPNGARAVRTIPITAPGAVAVPVPAPLPPTVSAAAPQPARIITAAVPTPPLAPAPSAVGAPKAAPPPAAATQTAAVATEAPRKVAKAPAPAEAAPSGASGFVAVVVSRTSRVDAMKGFADLQQKYGEVLGSKPAEVKEANLGDKGTWYRAVVGPPGSRDAASNVCSQLKTAGFTGCWVSGY